QRHGDPDHPERVLDRGPDLLVLLEQVAVVGRPDPARRREQVVVREGEVGAEDERVAEEDPEAQDPRAHAEQNKAAATPDGRPSGAPAIDCRTGRGGEHGRPGLGGADHGGPPPPFLACASWASICLSSDTRALWRFSTWPACHLTANAWIRSW